MPVKPNDKNIEASNIELEATRVVIFINIRVSIFTYNTNGKINAIPIITYHNLTNSMQELQ
jgi:hypothetical protein